MALISDLPNATPQKSDLMEIQNGQTSSNNSSVGQLMQLSASENLAPAYDANAGVYEVGDFVTQNGTLYQCNTAIATPEAFDATKWTAVKVTEISSGASVIQKTQAEYDHLTTEQKMNGSIYKITDNAKMYCLDKAYHPVEECTVAEYNQKTSAQQNNGTIYIQTDAETTGEDIPVNTLTPDISINSAINACFGRTGSDIPVSTGKKETIAEAIEAVQTEVDSIPTSLYGGYQNYSVAVAANTNTAIATVTLPHGTWLVLGTADLSSNVPSVYNFVLDDRVARASGESGGGVANYIVFRSYEGHESFTIYGYVKAATTYRATINWIRLDGLIDRS